VIELILSQMSMQLLVGSNGCLLNNNNLGILLTDYLYMMMLHYKMLKIREIEIFPHSLDKVKEEFMPLLHILTLT
jgi:hypothetical protein